MLIKKEAQNLENNHQSDESLVGKKKDDKMLETNVTNQVKNQLKSTDQIKNNPVKKKELSDCRNHEEVIILTEKWGFEISKRWGEY